MDDDEKDLGKFFLSFRQRWQYLCVKIVTMLFTFKIRVLI
jgi:hypothetical protein